MLTAALGASLPERTSKTCSRCGGPLETRHLQGLEVEVCVRCGAAVLDRADLENLAASAVLSAPEARSTESGVVVSRTPVRPERKKPWDFTPRPAPPRKAPKRVDKPLIHALAEEGGDETTEEGPMVVGHRIHESEPPVRPRDHKPESESPTGPPAPAPFPRALAPRGPGGIAIGPKASAAEPALKRVPEAPPLPPKLGRTVRPDDGNAPSVRPSSPVNLTPEPVIGRIASGIVDEPGLDLEGPEPSTEEAFFDTTQKVVPRSDPDEVVEWEDGRGKRVRSGLFFASALAALASLAAIAALGAWVFWVGPAWRQRAATVDGPDLTQIVGSPSGDLVIEHPDAVDPVVPDEAEVEVAPVPDDGTGEEGVDEPVIEPEPEPPAPVPTPTPRVAAPRPAPRDTAPSRASLIERGWATVESDPDSALEAFGKVLAADSDDYEAAYGYGYALLEKSDAAGAGPYLCRARPSPDVTIQREVAGLLTRNAIQCP